MRRWDKSTGIEPEMGCLFAIAAGVAPRLAFFIYWIARPGKVDAAFSTVLWPVLGIIFLPLTTLVYVLLYTVGVGVTGGEWFWIVLAFVLDLGHWFAGATQRNQIPTGQRA
jgi:hypothetical protein